MNKENKKKHRQTLYEASLKPDIRYRGPLSYRHLRILGWICIVLSQIWLLVSIGTRYTDTIQVPEFLNHVLPSVASLSVPFLILANYTVILNTRDGYHRLLRLNGIAAGVVALLSLMLYYRYFIGLITGLIGDRHEAMATMNTEFAASIRLPVFNFYIDLFLCTLFMFFLNYKPNRVFTGAKLRIFRAFAVIPVLYELASIVLKICETTDVLVLPFAVFPFMTAKPPVVFLVFIVLAIYIKNRERRFIKYGGTHAGFEKFLNTNRNSLHFSVFTSIVFLIAALLDVILMSLAVEILMSSAGPVPEAQQAEVFLQNMGEVQSLGLGQSTVLIPIIPFVLLFSYTRVYKSKLVDLLIPLAGILLIAFIYVEAGYQVLRVALAAL